MADATNTTNPSLPLEVWHPSYFIAEELKARGWSIERLAREMGGDDWTVDRFALDLYFVVGPTNPNCRMGSMADDIARAFDVSPEFIRNMEAAWLRAALTDGDA